MVFSVFDRPRSGAVKSTLMKSRKLKPGGETSTVPGCNISARPAPERRMIPPNRSSERTPCEFRNETHRATNVSATRLRQRTIAPLFFSLPLIWRVFSFQGDSLLWEVFTEIKNARAEVLLPSGLDVRRLSVRDRERTNFLPKSRGSNDFALSSPRKNPRHDLLQ